MSSLANPLGRSGESEAAFGAAPVGGRSIVDEQLLKEGGKPIEAVGSVGGGAVKSLGERVLEALTGMPGGMSAAGMMGTTLFFPRGLWTAARDRKGRADGFAGLAFGSAAAYVSDAEADVGISVAEGEPLRAMVGAARLLSEEEGNDGEEEECGSGKGLTGPLLILPG
ncbi:MAG: hypothetical protein PHO89_04770 [Methylacidiphilaceae bacterium]|nr:hypothetical protein [Candidatus Methylacidiphilaceae bacterium]